MLAIAFMELSAREAEVLGTSPAAFRAFYDEALPRIFGYFRHRCGGSAPIAEDLTQETFFAAVAELKKGRQVEEPIPWIYGIARHKLLDHYRREARAERKLEAAWDSAEIADELLGSAEESRERATAALGAVAATQRAALVLCYVDGLSVPEAANVLGKSVEAVESLLARGRQSFKRAYLEASP